MNFKKFIMERVQLPQNNINEFLIIEALRTDGHLSINWNLIEAFKNPIPALVLSNYIDKYLYFKSKFKPVDGWFYLTHKNQERNLHLGEFVIRKNKKLLIELNLLETKMDGYPQKEWIKINFQTLVVFIEDLGFNSQSPCQLETKGHNKTILNTNVLFAVSNGEEEESLNGYITPKMFDEFYALYPRKVNRGDALTAWSKLCTKRGSDRVKMRVIERAIRLQKKSGQWQDIPKIPYPASWLNGSKWLNDAEDMVRIVNYKTAAMPEEILDHNDRAGHKGKVELGQKETEYYYRNGDLVLRTMYNRKQY